MPALFIYLIKVNVALLIFCAGYYAVLRHLTFYNLNRIYLVTAIIFSTLYPKVNLSDFLNRHEEIAKPIQVVIVNWQEPVKTITKTFLGHDVWFWLLVTFWAGVILFAIRLSTQLLSLYRLHKRSEPAQLHQYVIRVIKGNINPFSFWRNIYINPENHAPQELSAILEHEHIHVSEWHTLDILLGELSAIFYWFNPGVWLMKRAIRENIEFITDNKILLKGIDSKAYQYSLLNVNFGTQGNAIVNHFNISTIKKRIIMMNAKRSSNVNITRYLFLIPAVMLLLLIFSVSKAELNKAVKSSAHNMITTFKTVITKIDFTAPEVPATPARKKLPVLTAVSTMQLELDTVPAKASGKILLTDTGRKFTLRLRGVAAGDKEPDVYINGVKTEFGLATMNPNDIATIDIRKDATAGNNGSIYIVTKGHEGKEITNRIYIDTLMAGTLKGKVDHVVLTKSVNGVLIDGKGKEDVIVTGYPSRVTTVRLNGKVVPGSQIHNVTVKGDSIKPLMLAIKADTRVINGVKVYNIKRTDGTTSDSSIISVTDQAYVKGNNIAAMSTTGPVRVVTGYGTAPSKIDHISDKLIILNGKEVSQKQLKKVSAGDIESVSVLSHDAAISQYGDKGKKGVVVITTRK
ncbi:MAG: M56 family metallopeptidase [Bacteroidota bacterium]